MTLFRFDIFENMQGFILCGLFHWLFEIAYQNPWYKY